MRTADLSDAQTVPDAPAESLAPYQPGRLEPQLPAPQTPDVPLATDKAKRRRLTNIDRAFILKAYDEGLTQVQIAQRLACAQSSVSEWLSTCYNTTELSKRYLQGQALKMSQDIVAKGRPADKVAVLKGLSVLADEAHSGVTVIVGGSGQVNIGIALSPPPKALPGETLQILSVNSPVSDK